jgi:phosphate transport system substrate-binding protein
VFTDRSPDGHLDADDRSDGFRRVRSMKRFAAIILLTGLAACGGSTSSGSGDGLSGSVVIDGSSTVAPLSEAVAEEFNAEEPGVDVSVGTSGTGGGFKRFCADEIDVADASRAIKDEEKAACADKGVDYLELRVGLDGLAVVTSAQNTFVDCLTFEQLAAIFKEGGASTWDQVDPGFPKEKIAIFAPGTDSGTYDFFVEEVLGEDGKARADYQASEDDNTLVQGIEGERNSWGYFGFAYFTENKEKLKAVKVSEAAGGECVAPSDETVAGGDYPLSRPLYIYVKKASLERPEVREFVRFYLELTPEVIGDVGYTAAPEEDYTKALAQLEESEQAGE